MKLKFSAILCLSVFNVYSYISMPGPLQLNDTVDASGFVTQRGEIMKTLLTTTSLHFCVQDLMRFDGVDSFDKLGSYQSIMQKLENKTNQDSRAVELAIEALEYAIMYTYDKQIYIVGGYVPYLSLVFSGLRWRALNPFSYLNPFSWLGENHAKGTQLICEFEQLSKIAENCYGSAYRLKATTFSCKHWRAIRNAAIIAGAALIIYLSAKNDHNRQRMAQSYR